MAAAPLHPRASYALQGLDAAVASFMEARARGRLHHAWLLTGPEGMGKASFAYRAARRLLGARPTTVGADDLASSPDDPVCRMVAAQSHPDLMVLERWSEANPTRKSIPVDEARRLPEFFSKAPAIAAYRVAIIDAADDLNVNAANAVLKTLEEPSGRGALFLVSHAPGRLLPTIRSRCRRLAFAPWPEQELIRFIDEHLELDADDAHRLARMSRGAPGRALSLAARGALDIDRQVEAILDRLPTTEGPELLGLADSFRGSDGGARFNLLLERIADRLQAGALAQTEIGALAAADRWSGAWDRLSRLPDQVEALNLDRADAFWSLMGDLRAVAAHHPLNTSDAAADADR
jgi:DNA polymerase-3 subunit delta'